MLVIAETVTGNYHYHLRLVGAEGVRLGGGTNLLALCGAKLGWDTQVPLAAWGQQDHIPSHWCRQCEELATKEASEEKTARQRDG